MEEGKLNSGKAKLTLEQMLISGESVQELLSEDDLKAFDDSELEIFCKKAIEQNPKIVADYKGGKEKAIMAHVGAVMRDTKGKAQADKVKEKLKNLL